MRTPVIASVALALSTSVGCANGTGPEAERVQVTLQRSAALVAADGGQSAPIANEDVETLTASLTRIEFLRADDGDGTNDEGGWIVLTVDPALEIDFTALPTETDAPLVIAAADVPIGNYVDVRLFVSNPTIVFTRDIVLGSALTFDAGESYEVTIPSGDQTGIKTSTDFSVSENAGALEVHLLFDAAATFQNVSGTGNGKVMMAPVIRDMP